MKKTLPALVLLLAVGAAGADTPPPWGYAGAEGPEHWGELSADFGACASGQNQSPIDLHGFTHAQLKPLGIQYGAQGNQILNNGHAIQVNFAPGSSIRIDGIDFELRQFHFHDPSENLINGKRYPLEAHLVHADKDGHLAVVAVMFSEGKENPFLAKVWSQMPTNADGPHSLAAPISAMGLLPSQRGYYRYNGSLTTPPCSEGVRWLVMKKPVSASAAQIEQFAHVMHHENNRPVQAVNARLVLE